MHLIKDDKILIIRQHKFNKLFQRITQVLLQFKLRQILPQLQITLKERDYSNYGLMGMETELDTHTLTTLAWKAGQENSYPINCRTFRF